MYTIIPTTTHHLQSQSIWLGFTIITTLSFFFLRITTLSINNLCRFKLYQRRHAVSVLKQNHSPILCCQEMKATAALPTSKPITPSNQCTSSLLLFFHFSDDETEGLVTRLLIP
ncbi:hypothetical protein PVAP13_3KG561950 [Panicum virgatum]|uniref:Uncharacterized protein n=1 Tax=Panicum virgatum TaxID=38727 RepID=A0A8T0V9D4_PANVG|nr:hypothetical protein PVAP13_3KG561950 [Panicum virgatum]